MWFSHHFENTGLMMISMMTGLYRWQESQITFYRRTGSTSLSIRSTVQCGLHTASFDLILDSLWWWLWPNDSVIEFKEKTKYWFSHTFRRHLLLSNHQTKSAFVNQPIQVTVYCRCRNSTVEFQNCSPQPRTFRLPDLRSFSSFLPPHSEQNKSGLYFTCLSGESKSWIGW